MNKKINPGKMQFVDPTKLAETIQQLQNQSNEKEENASFQTTRSENIRKI
jgi:hypothetical protein